MMHVAFINENTLGHASYLTPFVRTLEQRPELGITPHPLNATPLPPDLQRWADTTIPGLRRWGLDFHNARWRLTVSRHVRDELQRLRARQPIDAVVVNTQSVALALAGLDLPVLVCLDATFEQLAQSPWFAPNPTSRRLLPLTTAGLRGRERKLFRQANRLLPWSRPVAQSLVKDYALPAEKISVLPPSLALSPLPPRAASRGLPQVLFLGGDFKRKGGPVLLECYRQHFAGQFDLHLVTQSDVAAEPGVFVHRGLTAHTPPWRERWEQADLFVFPSTLETFGIVLLEALSFGVPVISSDAGAARDILCDGKAGWLLPEVSVPALKAALTEALANPAKAQAFAACGRQQVEERFELAKNTARLAGYLQEAVKP